MPAKNIIQHACPSIVPAIISIQYLEPMYEPLSGPNVGLFAPAWLPSFLRSSTTCLHPVPPISSQSTPSHQSFARRSLDPLAPRTKISPSISPRHHNSAVSHQDVRKTRFIVFPPTSVPTPPLIRPTSSRSERSSPTGPGRPTRRFSPWGSNCRRPPARFVPDAA